ncbi:TetR/AcrR family transcriptional regulator [Methylomonas montana]|uniref:TetR/AcrR family transcriptional regulator n=1 Tax=Methylomonas montana TaxID=3058963 RepID=UPI0026598AE7|nr:TetR/AcrR family transcriptional regulator [Methylomonas montana]WKJ92092.1 TetR/AcrR family transcriptional regulator [Methylomonas montana]
MARRSEHSQEQIREMVLVAAETIVVEDGFNALTVRKIAMEIGYTVGSIYMVFANMNDLATHVKARTLDELAKQLSDCAPTGGVEQHILTLAETYLNFAAQHFNRWRMIFDVQSEEAPPEWYQQKIEQLFAIVEELFKQLTPNGSPEQSRLAARTLWSGVHGICILSLTAKPQTSDVEVSKLSVDLLVNTFIQGWKAVPLQADAIPPGK